MRKTRRCFNADPLLPRSMKKMVYFCSLLALYLQCCMSKAVTSQVTCKDFDGKVRHMGFWFPQETCTLNCTCESGGELLCRPLCHTKYVVCNNIGEYINRVVYHDTILGSPCRFCTHEICDAINRRFKAYMEITNEELDDNQLTQDIPEYRRQGGLISVGKRRDDNETTDT